MKNRLTILCLTIFVLAITCSKANAQFTVGVKVAGNATNYMNFSELDGGVDAGVFLRLGERFYFQPEANYSFRSTKIQDVVNEMSENVRLKQHFIDVPLLLGYNFINKDNFKFHLIVGPRFGVRMGSNIDEIQVLTDESGKTQWGGQFGLGFDFWRFTLDARYDISANKFSEISGNPEFWKQNMIVVSLGFKFIK
ncbi:MAG: PorT family protein [Bacteroidales bacterium]|nr:PorT family protein [Bacteroidales bacterium]